MNNIIKIIIPLLVFIGSGSLADVKTEASKSALIKKILSEHELVLVKNSSNPFSEKAPDFCERFYKDFKNQINIKFVEPLFYAESFEDKLFAPYKKQCPTWAFNKIESGSWQAVDTELLKTRKNNYGWVYTATKDLRMYKVDIDNNPNNGKEDVFFTEEYFNKNKAYGWEWGGYSVLSFDKCNTVYGVSVKSPYDHFYKNPYENVNGIIVYENKNMIFDLYELRGEGDGKYYRLHLDKYRNDEKLKKAGISLLAPACTYSKVVYKGDKK